MRESNGFDYRPTDYGELLDRTFVLYRRNWRLALGLTFPVLFPSALLVGLANIGYQWALRAQGVSQASSSTQWVLVGLATTAFFGATTLHAILALFVQVMLVRAGSELYLGNSVTVRELFRFGLGHILTLLVTMFIVTICVSAGLVAFLIPGILVSVYWTLVVQTVAVEEKSFFGAMSRSWHLVEGNWWHAAVFAMLLSFLLYVLELMIVAPSQVLTVVELVTHPAAIFPGQTPNVLMLAAQGIFSAIAAALISPIGAFALTLFYYDLRARKEGFDLVTRAERMMPASAGAE